MQQEEEYCKPSNTGAEKARERGFLVVHVRVMMLSGESCRSFMRELNAEVVPPYMVASKDVVKEKMAPIWTKKKNVPKVTDSFHQYMVNVS